MLAAAAFISDNVNYWLKTEPLDHPRPAIRAKLPKVAVTDGLTGL